MHQLTWGRHRADLEVGGGQILLTVDRLTVVHCDAVGRLLRAVLGPSTFRRSYDGRFLEVMSEAREGERFHVPRVMSQSEAIDLTRRIAGLVGEALASTGDDSAKVALHRILGWSTAALTADAERFREVYPRVPGALPPDQQWSMVLQPPSAGDFAHHIEKAREFLGEAVAMRHSIYLDGLFTMADLDRLLPTAATTCEGPIGAPLVSASGLDAASLERWRRYRLLRLYLPLEGIDAAALRIVQASGLRAALLAEAPLTAASAEDLARQVTALSLQNGDTLYVKEPAVWNPTWDERLAVRRSFHHLRAHLPFSRAANAPTVSHFPLLQSVY